MSTLAPTRQLSRLKQHSSASSVHSLGRNGKKKVNAIPKNSQELIKLLETLCEQLASHQEWEKRVEALKTLLLVTKELFQLKEGGSEANSEESRALFDIFIENLRILRLVMNDAVTDLRSAVVREACYVLIELAKLGKGAIAEPLAESLLAPLVRITPVTIAVIAESGASAAKALVENVQSIRMVRATADVLNIHGLAPAARSVVAELVYLSLQHQKPNDIEKCVESFERAIYSGVQDASASVRSTSRKNFWLFAKLFPTKAQAIAKSLDTGVLKSISEEKPKDAPFIQLVFLDDGNQSISSHSQLHRPRKSISSFGSVGRAQMMSEQNETEQASSTCTGHSTDATKSEKKPMDPKRHKKIDEISTPKKSISNLSGNRIKELRRNNRPPSLSISPLPDVPTADSQTEFPREHEQSNRSSSATQKDIRKKSASMRRSDIGKLPQRVAISNEIANALPDSQSDSSQSTICDDIKRNKTISEDNYRSSIVPSITSETGRQIVSHMDIRYSGTNSETTMDNVWTRRKVTESDLRKLFGKIVAATDWKVKVNILARIERDLALYLATKKQRKNKTSHQEHQESKESETCLEDENLFTENTLQLLLQYLSPLVGESHTKVAAAALQLLSKVFQTFENGQMDYPNKEQQKLAQILEKEGTLIRRLFQRLSDPNSFVRSSSATTIEDLGKAVPWIHLRSGIICKSCLAPIASSGSNLDSSPRVMLHALLHLRHSYRSCKEYRKQMEYPNSLENASSYKTTTSISMTGNIAEPGSSPVNRISSNADAAEFAQLIISYIAPLAYDKNADLRKAACDVLMELDELIDPATILVGATSVDDGKHLNLIRKLGLLDSKQDSSSCCAVEGTLASAASPECSSVADTLKSNQTGDESYKKNNERKDEDSLDHSSCTPPATNNTGLVSNLRQKFLEMSISKDTNQEEENISSRIGRLLKKAQESVDEKESFGYLSQIRDVLRKHSHQLNVSQVTQILGMFLPGLLNISKFPNEKYAGCAFHDGIEMEWMSEILLRELWKQTPPLVLLNVLEFYIRDWTGDKSSLGDASPFIAAIQVLLQGTESLLKVFFENRLELTEMDEKRWNQIITFVVECVEHTHLDIRKSAVKCLAEIQLHIGQLKSTPPVLNDTQRKLVECYIQISNKTIS